MTNGNEMLIHPFPPVYDKQSKVLILGSFPSVISRKNHFYYGNPQNRFWRVMEMIYNDSAEDKMAFALRHHIALWDVIYSCTITGSSDSSIRNATVNDIGGLIRKTKIRAAATTGGYASKLYEQCVHLEIPHIALPSTSGANARMSLEDLCRAYRVIKEITDEKS